ncbi:hypothetical protein [Streptomyces sp. NPDC050428]|uniref:hypothetical protein n=1 Tax=Streptomyces sp. NPDC050428 TaxID=3155757 RepID=UPI00342D4953
MTDYAPTQSLEAALASYSEAERVKEEARLALRGAIAQELKTQDISSKVLAPHTPWSEETLRSIAREYGVPLKRAATVKSIKPKRRKPDTKPA